MSESQLGKGHQIGTFQLALLVYTILVLCALVADTLLALPKQISDLIHMIDTLGCVLFFADFCYRLYRAESKLRFMKWGWIDLIASVPNLEILRWGRLVRVLRIIRLLRGVRSIQIVLRAVFRETRGRVGSILFSAVLLVAFSSVSVLVCERQPDANIKTAEDAVWWSITTLSTVGYGDKYPVTTEGRVVGVILMVAGVSMFGCLSGLAASFFLGEQERSQSEMNEVLARLDRLQTKLDALSQERRE
jgi:voltage-gated potassium channel